MDTPLDAPASLDEPQSADRSKLSGDEHAFLDHLKKVNDTFYDQIRIADQKAAYIFTFMVAFLVTSDGRAVFSIERYRALFDVERYSGGEPVAAALSAAIAASVLASLISAILVVLPRNGSAGTSLYWNAWAANRPRFLAALERDEPSFLFNEYLGNVDALSAINRKKYRFVAVAFRALIVTVLGYCLLLAWGVPTGLGG